MTTAPIPVLAAQGLTKRFLGTTALAEVDFSVQSGCVHALIGENGAGKSTLVKILAGVEQPTSGGLLFAGEPVRFTSPRDAGQLGIDIIHQELQRFPDLSIDENLFVGRERRTRLGTIDRAAQRKAAAEVLHRLGQHLDIGRRVGSLPLGQQQIVEIGRAVVHDTRVLMMDEPTSALTASEIPVLFNLIRELTGHGVGIVYISHRLEELLAIADEVTVLRDGAVVGQAPRADVSVGWIVQRMTGREMTEASVHQQAAAGEPILVVKDLRLPAAPGRTGLRGVSIDVRPGEILGLYGLMGAGRTELMESVLGVHADAEGSVLLQGRELAGLDVRQRIAGGMAMVPEDRQAFAPDVVTNAPTEGRLVVVVLDRNIAYGRAAQTARELGAAIVDQLGPGDLASVVHTAHLNPSQNFTADRQRLLAAIDSKGVGNSLALGAGRAIGDCPCGVCSVDTVAHIARLLTNAGPRQKTIFFIGSGIATAIDPPGEMEEKTPTAAGNCIRDRWVASQAMFAAAQQANVVVHTLDPSGLGEPPSRQHVQYNPDSLRELASATGGRVVLNSNEPTRDIAPVFEEGQSYYLLAFEPGPPLASGRMRRVDVTVNRPGLEVRTRRGYHPAGSLPTVTTVRTAARDRVATHLAELLPNSALPLTMALLPVAEPGRDDPAVGIVLGVDRGTRSSDGGRIALSAMAFDANGREQGSVRQVFDAAALPYSFDVLARMYLRPGQYEIRATVTAGASPAGSVYGYVDVPDFRRQRLSLSGVALRRRGRVALPADGLSAVLPTVPSSERAFAPTDRVTGFVRIYQQSGGRPVTVSLTAAVLDSSDKVVTEHTMSIEAARFEPVRAEDFQFELPLAKLVPGNYLLRLDATAGRSTVTRGARFSVR